MSRAAESIVAILSMNNQPSRPAIASSSAVTLDGPLMANTTSSPSLTASQRGKQQSAALAKRNRSESQTDELAGTSPETTASGEGEHDGTSKGQTAAQQQQAKPKKKKKANRACAACQKAHLTCDDGRPCSRCVKKGLGDECTDGVRKRAKYLLDEEELELVKAKEKAEKEEKDRQQREAKTAAKSIAARPMIPSIRPAPPPPPLFQQHGRGNGPSVPAPGFSLANGATIAPSAVDPFTQDPFGQTDAATHTTPPHAFGSEATSLEYSILSAMLNGIDPTLLSGEPHGDGGVSSNGGYAEANGQGLQQGDIDLKSFFQDSGTNLPTVGMASDLSSHWLGNSTAYNNSQGRTWAPHAASPSSSFANNNSHFPGSRPAGEPIGQLHAIGGQDSTGAEGEVGGGGFKALEVPSPSPSIASNRLLEEGQAASPSESGGAKTQTPASSHGTAGTSSANAVARGPMGLQAPSLMEAQWRDRVNHIYADSAKPFPYTEGYHFLLKFVTEKFEKAEVLRIVRALGLFRPSLIALQMPLTEEDEIFVERSIQRTVLEFEKLVSRPWRGRVLNRAFH